MYINEELGIFLGPMVYDEFGIFQVPGLIEFFQVRYHNYVFLFSHISSSM